jgi:hypothetical protein
MYGDKQGTKKSLKIATVVSTGLGVLGLPSSIIAIINVLNDTPHKIFWIIVFTVTVVASFGGGWFARSWYMREQYIMVRSKAKHLDKRTRRLLKELTPKEKGCLVGLCSVSALDENMKPLYPMALDVDDPFYANLGINQENLKRLESLGVVYFETHGDPVLCNS